MTNDNRSEEEKPKRDRDWQAKLRAQEAALTVCVLDAVEGKRHCADCKREGLLFFVQLIREPFRPIVALCKRCAIQRAEGEEQVYVRDAIGPWLRKWWRNNRSEAKRLLSENHKEALQKARVARGKGEALDGQVSHSA